MFHNDLKAAFADCYCFALLWYGLLQLQADRRPHRDHKIKEIVMAKVIEFYVPKSFRKPLKWAPRLQYEKIIKFCSPTKKSA